MKNELLVINGIEGLQILKSDHVEITACAKHNDQQNCKITDQPKSK